MIGGSALLCIDLLFMAANLTKLVHGAWLPLLIAVTTFIIMTTWQRGSAIVAVRREAAEGPLQGFVDQLSRPRGLLRVPGTAVFLSRGNWLHPDSDARARRCGVIQRRRDGGVAANTMR